MSNRVKAYAMLTHHALNEIDDEGCCTNCCAPCAALQVLDKEGVLDLVVLEWDEYSDGTKVLREARNPSWWTGTAVDREWLYKMWEIGPENFGCVEYHK